MITAAATPQAANPTADTPRPILMLSGIGLRLNLNPQVPQLFAATEFLTVHSGQRILLKVLLVRSAG
jgi:hypothetical protein